MRRARDLKPEAWQPSTWILATLSVAAILCVAITGGRSSPIVSVLFLPMLLAVVGLPVRSIVPFGFGLACVYLALPSGRGATPLFDASDIGRVVTFALMTLVGSFYGAQVQRERARWNEAVEEQEALLNVSQVVNSCEKLEYALNSALLMLRSMMPAVHAAGFYLLDEGGHFLIRHADLGPLRLRERIRVEELPPGWTLSEIAPLVASDYPHDMVTRDREPEERARRLALASLRSLNLPIGMLSVELDGPDDPSPAQLRLLQGFAERVGFPLQKIRMQEGLHSLAYTDPMTGLQNYRAFRATLDDEWKRSVRYRRPLSVILIDLDGFKGVNDRYGHPAGDKLLAGIAGILQETVRETDIPARYGGEEFAVVCPETSHEDVDVVAERIRAAVERARFQLVADESTAVTCSVGIATYPSNATTEEALIDAADAALYFAKRCGKNTVRSADSLPFLATETGT